MTVGLDSRSYCYNFTCASSKARLDMKARAFPIILLVTFVALASDHSPTFAKVQGRDNTPPAVIRRARQTRRRESP